MMSLPVREEDAPLGSGSVMVTVTAVMDQTRKTAVSSTVKLALVTTCLQQAHVLFSLKMVSH